MASRRCPSCGERYNGKRCRNCLYEPFGEVRTSYDLHQEEILVPREISRPDLSRPARKQKRSSSAGKVLLKRLGTFWVVFMLLTGAVPALVEIVGDLAAESFMEATPEPVPLPNSGVVLYEDADILVLADWDGTPINSDLSIYVQNFTGKDLTVCTDGVAVNGCMAEEVFFYCDAYRNSVSRASLWMDMDTLGEMGINEGRYIQMTIDVMDEDYNVLVENAPVTLGSEYIQGLDGSGTTLYDQEGFLLVYQGMEEDQFGDPQLVFYGENNTEHFLELSGNELLIDGEESGCWLWQNFLPGTRGIFYGHIHDIAIPDDNVPAEVELFLTPDGDWSREILLGSISFPLN